MRPLGDDGHSTKGLGRAAPTIKGHHSFDPKEASTLIVGEESLSHYNLQKDDIAGISSYLMHNSSEDVIANSLIQNQLANQSWQGPAVDHSNIMMASSMQQPGCDASFVGEVQNLISGAGGASANSQ